MFSIYKARGNETDMSTNSFEPMNNINDIYKVIDSFVDDKIRKSVNILSYIGEEFCNAAKLDGSYRDQTSNLRNSIGYIIVFNEKITNKGFPGNKTEAVDEALEYAKRLSESNSKASKDSPILIGIAGMEYAAAVEHNGYEVISNSANKAEEILNRVIKKLDK
jgi:hypothetical protein